MDKDLKWILIAVSVCLLILVTGIVLVSGGEITGITFRSRFHIG